MSRSFCLFEAFATVYAGKPLLCQAPRCASKAFAEKQIYSEQATTRSAADKHEIDSFIEGTVGFGEFNDILAAELKRSLEMNARSASSSPTLEREVLRTTDE